MKYSALLSKQTLNPPKRVVALQDNPLARWSRYLTHWSGFTQLLASRVGDKVSTTHGLPYCTVGLEGCGSAFNATAAMRTCRFFETGAPPVFLRVKQWDGIEHIQKREAFPQLTPEEETTTMMMTTSTTGTSTLKDQRIALFGEDVFTMQLNCDSPIVALENFTSRSESVFRRRFPSDARLVVGHENHGVRDAFLHPLPSSEQQQEQQEQQQQQQQQQQQVASCVLYVPQYGTISSLNVVTSLGIALFYAYLDLHHPLSRTLCEDSGFDDEHTPTPTGTLDSRCNDFARALQQKGAVTPAEMRCALRLYETFFEEVLPTPTNDDTVPNLVNDPTTYKKELKDPNINRTPRVDARPIHPLYYKKDMVSIHDAHKAYRDLLLKYSTQSEALSSTGDKPTQRFGLSLLYENDLDQRNFGGLIRNANAFLIDQVCYIGRRKYNSVGSVGSYHYTPPVYLGPCFAGRFSQTNIHQNSDQRGNDEETKKLSMNAVELSSAELLLPDNERLLLWRRKFREKVEEACGGGPVQLWLLDCGHGELYASDAHYWKEAITDIEKASLSQTEILQSDALYARSSGESLAWYADKHTEAQRQRFLLSCCDTEERLHEAAHEGGKGTVLLLVPQEGKLPHISILGECSRILKILPDDGESKVRGMGEMRWCGLSSQVASGIAMQRLSSVLHPRIKEL